MKAAIIDESRPLEDIVTPLPTPEAWALFGEDEGGIAIVVDVFGMSLEVSLTEQEAASLNTLPKVELTDLFDTLDYCECTCDSEPCACSCICKENYEC